MATLPDVMIEEGTKVSTCEGISPGEHEEPDQTLQLEPHSPNQVQDVNDCADKKDWKHYIEVASHVTDNQWRLASKTSDQLWDHLMQTAKGKVIYKGVTLMETHEGPQPHPEILIGVKDKSVLLPGDIPNPYNGVAVRVIQYDIEDEELFNGDSCHSSRSVFCLGSSVAKEDTPDTTGSLGCFLKSSSKSSAVFFITCYHNFVQEVQNGPTVYHTQKITPNKGDKIQVNQTTLGEYYVGIQREDESDVCLVKLNCGVKWNNMISHNSKCIVLKHTRGKDDHGSPKPYTKLCKIGAATGYTEGLVDVMNEQMDFGPKRDHRFKVVSMGSQAICGRGDSGSVFVDIESGHVAGLLYTGSGKRKDTHNCEPMENILKPTKAAYAYPFSMMCKTLQQLDESLEELRLPTPDEFQDDHDLELDEAERSPSMGSTPYFGQKPG